MVGTMRMEIQIINSILIQQVLKVRVLCTIKLGSNKLQFLALGGKASILREMRRSEIFYLVVVLVGEEVGVVRGVVNSTSAPQYLLDLILLSKFMRMAPIEVTNAVIAAIVAGSNIL